MDCGVITSKSVLLLISLIFWGAAAGLSYVGGYVLNSYKEYDPFLEDKEALLPAVIIICVAVVMFAIGLIGCCATIRESRIGLGVFLIIILMIFAAEVAAFVLGFVYKSKIKSDLQEPMMQAFENYDGKTEESHVVDYLQQESKEMIYIGELQKRKHFTSERSQIYISADVSWDQMEGKLELLLLQCCGVQNYTNWIGSRWYNVSGNSSVPLSCCKREMSKNCTGSLQEPQFLNTQGCEPKVETILQSVLNYAMLVILAFAIVKFFGMLSICVLTCRRESSGYQSLQSGSFA